MFKLGAAVGTGVISLATTVCGLLLLGGVGPPASSTAIELPAPAVPSSSEPPPMTTNTGTTNTGTTNTGTTNLSTATTSPPSPTTTAPSSDSAPIPLAVEASTNVVGLGGEVRFDGTCPVGATGPLGPVQVVITPLDGKPPTHVDTGITAASWTYRWTAPSATADVSSFQFQFWCGDRSRHAGGYPQSLERRVDMVASAVATTTPPTTTAPQPALTIPETD